MIQPQNLKCDNFESHEYTGNEFREKAGWWHLTTRHSLWHGAGTLCNIHTKGNLVTCANLSPMIPILNDNSRQKVALPYSADYAHVGCHAMHCMDIIFMEFQGHCNFWKTWLREWTVKIGRTISLGFTPAFIKWFSPKPTTGEKLWRPFAKDSLIWH